MKAVVWQGEKDVQVETVPDPSLMEDTDHHHQSNLFWNLRF